jgi:hypothetical protein
MRAHPIELGFHIADAQEVALAYDGESLVLSFLDWREQPVRVAFDEAVAFRWQRAEEVHPGESWDGTNLHVDSPWLEEHRRQAEATTSHQHFALNFNAAGRLDVICTAARVVAG